MIPIQNLIIKSKSYIKIEQICISFILSSFIPFSLHLFSTWWVIKVNMLSKKQKIKQQQKMQLLFDKLPKQKITLRDVLKEPKGFNLFIRHLIKL